RESLRSEQLWVSQGSQDGRCSEQDLARSGGWKRVDRRCGPERLFWVGGPRKAPGPHLQASRRWPGAEAHSANAHGGLPRGGPPVCNPAGRGDDALNAKDNFAAAAARSRIVLRGPVTFHLTVRAALGSSGG